MKRQKNKRNKGLILCLTVAISLSGVGCRNEEDFDITQEITQEQTQIKDPLWNETEGLLLHTAPFEASGAPHLQARASILLEPTSGTILYSENLHDKIYPASMTKMLTALVVLDYFSPEELIVVGSEIYEVPWDSSKAGHISGETLTIKNLLRALVMPSGNDSSNVAAAVVARKASKEPNLAFADCETYFTNLMNEKAESLGALNTNFVNPHGYHHDDHYTTPYDLGLIAMEYMKHDVLREVAEETSYVGNGAEGLFSASDNIKTQEYKWYSHNSLITNTSYRYEYATGIKTGYTNEAGQCVATSATKDGETFIAIVFHSADPNRWLDSKALYEYGYDAYDKVHMAFYGGVFDTLPLTKQNPLLLSETDVVYKDEVSVYLPTDMIDLVDVNVVYEEDMTTIDEEGIVTLIAPIDANTVVGEVSFSIYGKTIARESIIISRDIPKGTIWQKIKYSLGQMRENLFTFQGLMILFLLGGIGNAVRAFLKKRTAQKRKRALRYTFQKPPRKGRF